MNFGPVYQNVSLPAITAGGPGGEATRHTYTLVQANGLRVLWLLLIPVEMSDLALVAFASTAPGQARRMSLLLTLALALLDFCAVEITLSACSNSRCLWPYWSLPSRIP